MTSQCNGLLFFFEDTKNSRRYYFSYWHAIKNSSAGKCRHTHMLQMQMRGNEHGTYSTHTARGFSILHYVFSRKQFILCSALRHKCCLTLLYVTSIRDFFCPWNNRARLYQAPASQPRVFARLLVDNNFGVVLNNDYVGPSGHLLFQTSRRLIYVYAS